MGTVVDFVGRAEADEARLAELYEELVSLCFDAGELLNELDMERDAEAPLSPLPCPAPPCHAKPCRASPCPALP